MKTGQLPSFGNRNQCCQSQVYQPIYHFRCPLKELEMRSLAQIYDIIASPAIDLCTLNRQTPSILIYMSQHGVKKLWGRGTGLILAVQLRPDGTCAATPPQVWTLGEWTEEVTSFIMIWLLDLWTALWGGWAGEQQGRACHLSGLPLPWIGASRIDAIQSGIDRYLTTPNIGFHGYFLLLCCCRCCWSKFYWGSFYIFFLLFLPKKLRLLAYI